MSYLIPDWLYRMPDPEPTAELQLQLKRPSLNWEGNLHENFKSFEYCARVLLDGPYKKYNEQIKVAALLSWTGDKGFKLYHTIDWGDKDKNKWEDILTTFKAHFKPCQTVMQSWYQLGSLYSSNCKDQSEFIARIKELVKEGAFTQQEEIIKFLFVIHNTNDKVREYLIDKADPTKTCSDFLNLARSVESMVQTETMSKQLLQNVGKLSVSSVGQAKGQRQRSFSKSKQGDRNRSSSGRRSQSQNQSTCGKCGKRYPPHKCPAYGQNYRCCGAKRHYAKCCKSKNPRNQRNPKERFSHKDGWEVSPEGPDDFEFEEDAIQIMFSKDSFHNNKHGQSSNIMFDEIEQTKALGDLLLSNKAGLRYTVRFKLDSGAGANLLPIGMYKKLFPDRKLNGTADKRIQLTAANKTRIKQLGTVQLRVHVGNKDKVCLFYVVPDKCRPIFGLPDLTNMR